MNRRIQRALDGELPVEQLTAAEREELASCEQAIARTLEQVPDPGPAPDMTGAVLWRIAHLPTGAPAHGASPFARPFGLLRWLWQPRPVRLRPVSAFAVVVLLLAAGLVTARRLPTQGATSMSAMQASQLVQFRLGADGVQDVALVGDFGGWNVRYPMEQIAPGVWSTAVPLEPGVYDYAFVVDGKTWTLDPLAPAVSDGFGGANSRLSVLAPERRTRT